MFRKFFVLLTSCILCFTAVLSFSGCAGDNIIVDEKVVNIRVYKGGYGADYIYVLKEKFEEAFADEGYKANILTPSYDMHGNVALTELAQGTESTGIDLYMTGGLFTHQVDERGNYGVLVEDLTEEVWNKPAIKFDGTEEDKPIIDKIPEGIMPYIEDNNGKLIGFNYMQSVSGMVVNTRKLAKYGLTIPKTTNEMFDCFYKIYLGNNGIENSETSTTFPITYVSGTNGYTVTFLEALMAQYEGLENYASFYSMNDEEGNYRLEDGYEAFKSQGLLEMLKVAYATFDVRIAAYGSTTHGVDQAQAKIMKDGNDAVFMCNGDWMFNEVKLNYKNQLNDIEFMNFPVISALGTKTFGAGTAYGLDENKCDELLSYMVGLVDEHKTIAEIIAAVKTEKGIDVAQEDALSIAEARGLYYSRGVDTIAYVAKNAVGKEPAMAFLRMFASDDFSSEFTKATNGMSAFAEYSEQDSEFEYINQVAKITTNPYVSLIRTRAQGLREKLKIGGLLQTTYHIPAAISGEAVSMFDGKGGYKPAPNNTAAVYHTAATAKWQKEYDNAESKWQTWLTAAGL